VFFNIINVYVVKIVH